MSENVIVVNPNADDSELPEEKFEFMTPNKFQLLVETYVAENDVSYIDAVLFYCDLYEIEFDIIGKLISSNLKEKLNVSAIEAGYFKEESSLPI